MLVLDASMALSWLFERDAPAERARALAALESLEQGGAMVPAIWQAEVLHALLVGERRKLVRPAQSASYLMTLGRLPIVFDSALPNTRTDSVMAVGRQHDLTAYDSIYLELAVRAGGPLASFDRHLSKAARSTGIDVV